MLVFLFTGIFILLLLGGCDQGNGEAVAANEYQSTLDQIPSATITSVPTALADLSELAKSYKQKVESNETDEAKKLAHELGGLWNAVKSELTDEGGVECQSIEADLESLITRTNSEPWEKELLIQLDYKLYQCFRDIRQAIGNGEH